MEKLLKRVRIASRNEAPPERTLSASTLRLVARNGEEPAGLRTRANEIRYGFNIAQRPSVAADKSIS